MSYSGSCAKVISFLLFTLSFLCCSDSSSPVIFPQEEIVAGDLVLRCGRGVASAVVLSNDRQGMFSHIGIVVRESDSLKVVHEVPGECASAEEDGIKMESLHRFFDEERATCGKVLHLSVADSVLLERVSAKALSVYRAGVLYDHDYNLSDTTRLYCTELVWHIYKSVGIDLTSGRRTTIALPLFSGKYILPSDIEENKDLSTVFQFNRN